LDINDNSDLVSIFLIGINIEVHINCFEFYAFVRHSDSIYFWHCREVLTFRGLPRSRFARLHVYPSSWSGA